jgi:hypothetical protein
MLVAGQNLIPKSANFWHWQSNLNSDRFSKAPIYVVGAFFVMQQITIE